MTTPPNQPDSSPPSPQSAAPPPAAASDAPSEAVEKHEEHGKSPTSRAVDLTKRLKHLGSLALVPRPRVSQYTRASRRPSAHVITRLSWQNPRQSIVAPVKKVRPIRTSVYDVRSKKAIVFAPPQMEQSKRSKIHPEDIPHPEVVVPFKLPETSQNLKTESPEQNPSPHPSQQQQPPQQQHSQEPSFLNDFHHQTHGPVNSLNRSSRSRRNGTRSKTKNSEMINYLRERLSTKYLGKQYALAIKRAKLSGQLSITAIIIWFYCSGIIANLVGYSTFFFNQTIYSGDVVIISSFRTETFGWFIMIVGLLIACYFTCEGLNSESYIVVTMTASVMLALQFAVIISSMSAYIRGARDDQVEPDQGLITLCINATIWLGQLCEYTILVIYTKRVEDSLRPFVNDRRTERGRGLSS